MLRENTAEFGITNFPMGDPGQGIVHVIGPEQGRTLPGMTIVCGDSHTATHGAFGALAFGIGTSEVEHVLATQTLPQTRPKWMAVDVEGELPAGVTAKDVILAVIGEIGTGGGIGHVIEYRGSAIRALSMEGRMTVCNMSIEAGAKAGLDRARRDDVRLPPRAAPTRRRATAWDAGRRRLARRCAPTTARCTTREVRIDATTLRPQVTWGTNPGQVAPIDGAVPVARRLRRPDHARDRRPGPRVHGPRPPARRSATSPSTPCSSARARTAASRTCAPPPPCSTGRHVTAPAGDGRARQPRREGAGRGRGPRPRSSPPPAPTGASRAAGCAWR